MTPMIFTAIKLSIYKRWPVAVAVNAMALIGLYVRIGSLSLPVILITLLTTLLATVLVCAPLEYWKLKHPAA
jgi:hypothetical protein